MTGQLRRPRIAVFDYEVSETSPSGSCHLRLLEGLADEYEFTVFATAFDNPDPSRIEWVKVPAIRRPLAALYASYLVSSVVARAQRERRGVAFDLVQAVEGYTTSCDVSYIHFCHRAYLKHERTSEHMHGLRAFAHRVDHRLRVVGERRALETPNTLVVPSLGLREDLAAEYAVDAERMRVIPNPIDVDRFNPPARFERHTVREELGASPEDLLLAFVALGHFERKGLPVLLEALSLTPELALRLVVVGGENDLVAAYRARANELDLSDRVRFVGMQSDIRPFLWAADAFASPSSYETFSLTLHQAAAAGLPLLLRPLRGVATFFVDGEHGVAITGGRDNLVRALQRLAAAGEDRRVAMGVAARHEVEGLGVPRFVEAWRALYSELLDRPGEYIV